MEKEPPRQMKLLNPELFQYSLLGIEMGAAVGIGVWFGHWLDVKLGFNQPWMLFLFGTLGFAAAGRALYRTASEMKKKMQGEEKKENEPRE